MLRSLVGSEMCIRDRLYICAKNYFTAKRFDDVIAKIKWCSFLPHSVEQRLAGTGLRPPHNDVHLDVSGHHRARSITLANNGTGLVLALVAPHSGASLLLSLTLASPTALFIDLIMPLTPCHRTNHAAIDLALSNHSQATSLHIRRIQRPRLHLFSRTTSKNEAVLSKRG